MLLITLVEQASGTEPGYYSNLDPYSIMTPVNVERLVELLLESGYDPGEIQFLQEGFTQGFDIRYEGPQDRASTSDNIPFSVGNKTILWNKLMKEVKLGRVAGPFEQIPFKNFIQSPIGLVPKGSDQTRLIFHLSYEFKRDKLGCVNFFTPIDKCSVHYKDLDYAVKSFLDLMEEMDDSDLDSGESYSESEETTDATEYQSKLKRTWRKQFTDNHLKKCTQKRVIFSGKSDLKSAFCILGLSKVSWRWLVMKARDPSTGIWKFFVDKCLPFGSSISCSHFQRFSDALCHLIEFRLGLIRKKRITNYLDDFLFIARTMLRCNFMINQFLILCEELGVPVSMEKTEWASVLVIFLGILLNGKDLVLAIPEEKCIKAVQLLEELVCKDKKKATVGQIQKLCGYLNFLCKAIFPGRPLIRRMYAKYSSIISLNGTPKCVYEYKLKQYHHVRIDAEFRIDCKIWFQFLSEEWQSAVSRPMVDVFNEQNANEIGFFLMPLLQQKWVLVSPWELIGSKVFGLLNSSLNANQVSNTWSSLLCASEL